MKNKDKNTDEPQPGPSGLQEKNNEKETEDSTTKENEKVSDKKLTKSEKKKQAKEKKVKIKNISFETQRRRSSSEQSVGRYRILIRPKGHQRSHSVRDLVPKAPENLANSENKKQIKTISSATSIHHDHNDATDRYFRSTLYGHHRESLSNLRKAHKSSSKNSLLQHHRHKGSETKCFKKHDHHIARCRQCFEPKSHCVCANMPDNHLQSDWMTLIRPKPDVKNFTRNRLQWLQELEENSEIDQENLMEENFNDSREICCFPFNTFQIFSQRDIKMTDYYKKVDSNQKNDAAKTKDSNPEDSKPKDSKAKDLKSRDTKADDSY
jgi:hypothetical protein